VSEKSPRSRSVYSVALELVVKSREAALAAIQLFNNPLITFKSESFIVLSTIAWTYLLHAYYRRIGVEYRYYRRPEGSKKRRFDRTDDGAFKYWDLPKCLQARECPLDEDTKANLMFLVGLRNEIVHRMCPNLDAYFSARYQACALNFSHYIVELFGEKYRIDTQAGYCVQLAEFEQEQAEALGVDALLPNVRAYVARFDGALADEQLNSERFAYRLVFTRREVNRPGQADRVVEFVSPDDPAAQGLARDHWVVKPVEKPKFLPGQIVKMMNDEGFEFFTMYQHTQLWKAHDAKNPAKGYGVEVGYGWMWYESWVDVVRAHCREQHEGRLRASGPKAVG
jgi:hypothetical protein